MNKSSYSGKVGSTEYKNTLAIKYEKDQCGLTVVLDCDEDKEDEPVISQPYLIDESIPCQYKVSFSSKAACPKISTNAIWVFLNNYDWLWGVFFIIMGLFLCFFGRKAFVAAIVLISAFATCFLIMLFFYSVFLKGVTAEWVGWVVLICSIIIGVIVGVLMMKL